MQDLLFDDVNRTGLIQSRLRWLHRNLKVDNKDVKVKGKRAAPAMTGGPTGGPTSKQISPDQDCQPALEETINKLNGLSSKSENHEIKALVEATLPHRNQLRSTNAQSILKIYNKFTECDFLVSFF